MGYILPQSKMLISWLITLHQAVTKLFFHLFFMFSRSRNPFFTVSQSYHVRKTSKIEVNFRFHRCLSVLMIGSYGFSWFLHSLRFQGQGILFSQFHKATMFGRLRKSRSTSGFTGARGYWWLGLMDFLDFFIPYVFEVKESIFRFFTEQPCLIDLDNPCRSWPIVLHPVYSGCFPYCWGAGFSHPRVCRWLTTLWSLSCPWYSPALRSSRSLHRGHGPMDVQQPPQVECFENGVHLAGLDSPPG